jgi:hypothetical protein
VGLLHDAAELGRVVLAQGAVVHVRRARAAVDLAVVGGEVLQRGDGLQIAAACGQQVAVAVPALHAVDELPGDRGGEQRVLAEGLVVAPPARVAREVDGG